MTLDFINVWKKAPEMMSGLKRGDPLAYLRVADEARTAQYTVQYLDGTLKTVKDLKSTVAGQRSFTGAFDAIKGSSVSQFQAGWASATDVTCFKFISNAKFHNAIPASLRFLNGSMLETSLGKGIVSKLGGQVAFKSALESGAAKTTATVTGKTAAKVAGKSLARIPVIGIVISALFEIPDLIDAKRNGDFGAQVGRSTLNVACTTAGMAIGAALGSAVFPPIGTVVGGFLGALVGGAIGKGLGNLLFGKSIKDKMIDGDMSRGLMRSYQNTNFYNAGTGRSMFDGSTVNTGGYGQFNPGGGGGATIDVNRLINSINQGMAQYN